LDKTLENQLKQLIDSTLENDVFNKLNKSRKDFIVSVLWHILSIKGRINFLQLGRFSPLCEQTFRNHFEKEFDFFSFNKLLIKQTVSTETIIALDPSYIPKAGKSTYGRGRYWSGVAGAAKWGLDIDDSVLKYKFTGEPTSKKGAPRKFTGLVDVNNFDPNQFSLDLSNEETTIYSTVCITTL